MCLPALLLRCLLALALVAGGVPTFGMAGERAHQDPAPAPTSCHDLEAPEPAAADHGADADCCASTDCLCDCLQHMPAAALAVPTLTTPVFPASAPSPRELASSSRAGTSTLRPPIG